MQTREKRLAKLKKYRETHKEERRLYLVKNKDKINQQSIAYHKKWRLTYPPIIRVAMTKEEYLARRRLKDRNRIKNDPMFRLSRNTGTLMYLSLRENKASKKWETLVGYSLDDLKTHLEKQFKEGMSWDNYGSGWHVDHIVPRSFFKLTSHNSEEFRKCWSLNNLQPLWARENISKGDKLPNGIRLIHI